MHSIIALLPLLLAPAANAAAMPQISPKFGTSMQRPIVFPRQTEDVRCGPGNGLRCDASDPNGGWCCSSMATDLNTVAQGAWWHMGLRYQNDIDTLGDSHRFRKCAIGDPENRPPPTSSITARPSPTALPGQRCGAENANLQCPAGECCSHAGYCGVTKDFCSVPGNCRREYGWCDSDESPNGYNLANEPRPKIGQVPYGRLITTCTTPNVIALTYDDGPSNNTEKLMDVLKRHDAKATFFVSGITDGKGEIDHEEKWVKTIRRMAMEGHQVGSHTWSHADLENMTSPARRTEIAKNERAMVNILNKYPTYMRPPYVKCSDTASCLSDVNAMGYHVVGYSLDSTDWQHPDDLDAMKTAFDDALNRTAPDGNMLLIQHDTIPMSSIDLTSHVLDAIKRRGWKGEYPAPSPVIC
ncbi:hypothetical protein LTR46_010385 [Exophiala xenobiotica]|nr:hypothetical protein LTR93_005956 [Exophiala xenobiotica]KAK5403023.1 hypothetical protein LTR06_010449 [Exophiala xenobiotica]KAK5551568.1 hypothetical protein LTR46_010385 [Exophiala xenobiotica]